MVPKSFSMGPNPHSVGRIMIGGQLFTFPPKNPPKTDLSNHVAIVTGASSGIGFHSCIHLLSLGLSHLVIAVRSTSKGEEAADKLRADFPKAKVDVWNLEMSSYSSIQSFVQLVEKNLTRLDIVIVNAGVAKMDFTIVETTGHEEDIQVNYLSTVLLSVLILPALKAKSAAGVPGRLSIVSSGTTLNAKFENRHAVPLLQSFDAGSKWDPNAQYADSKILGHYFMIKFADFVDPKDVIVNCVDPGLTKSSLLREGRGITAVIYAIMKALLARTPDVASTTYVDAAVYKKEESHGSYIMDWKITPYPGLIFAPDYSIVSEKLWEETMKELEFAGPLKILKSMKG